MGNFSVSVKLIRTYLGVFCTLLKYRAHIGLPPGRHYTIAPEAPGTGAPSVVLAALMLCQRGGRSVRTLGGLLRPVQMGSSHWSVTWLTAYYRA